jgi:Brp/Blh family beta-carotene 15,15'-monooxygenase
MSFWDMTAIAAILLLGVPHGGLDGAVARRVGWPAGLVPWLVFHLCYLALAATVALLWWLYPLPSLAIFLFVSALHFGASDIADIGATETGVSGNGTVSTGLPKSNRDWLPWIAHGGLVCIAIPSLQPALVTPIFAILVGTENASLLMAGITQLFLPWSFCLVVYCGYAYLKPHYRKPLLGLLLLVGLASILPPLISFSLYFCVWHSRGHLSRLWRSLALQDRARSLYEAAIYTGAAWICAGLSFYFLQGSAITSVIQLTFIGLAALTLPHMMLVDYADQKQNN